MRLWVVGSRISAIGSVLLLGIPLGTQIASAKTTSHAVHATSTASSQHTMAFSHGATGSTKGSSATRHADRGESGDHSRGLHGGSKRAMYVSRHGGKATLRYASMGGGGGISCVPYAREVSGIDLKGNAANWWDEADGVYARGNAPEGGSVLNFRANASMHLGHVAVVSNVISSREIEIDHANWWGPGAGKGGISRNISVVDVSPRNDWTAVRVGLGHTGEYGSIYPTYGFIYDRREGSEPRHTLVSASAEPAPMLNQAPRDLRSSSQRASSQRTGRTYDEVAEAPSGHGIDLNVGRLILDAPDRSLR